VAVRPSWRVSPQDHRRPPGRCLTDAPLHDRGQGVRAQLQDLNPRLVHIQTNFVCLFHHVPRREEDRDAAGLFAHE